MQNKIKNKTTLKQFIKFGLVGVSNTVIALATYYLLVYLGLHYLIANIVAFIISVLNAYFWNSRYVFKSDNRSHTKTIIKTYISYGITSALSTLLLYIFVDVVGFSKYIAPLITLLITIPANFMMNKFWTFRDSNSPEKVP